MHVISDSGPAQVGQERACMPSSGQSGEMSSMICIEEHQARTSHFPRNKMLISTALIKVDVSDKKLSTVLNIFPMKWG